MSGIINGLSGIMVMNGNLIHGPSSFSFPVSEAYRICARRRAGRQLGPPPLRRGAPDEEGAHAAAGAADVRVVAVPVCARARSQTASQSRRTRASLRTPLADVFRHHAEILPGCVLGEPGVGCDCAVPGAARAAAAGGRDHQLALPLVLQAWERSAMAVGVRGSPAEFDSFCCISLDSEAPSSITRESGYRR